MAAHIEAGSYTASVNGTQTTENVLSNGVRSVTCKSASLTGSLAAASETVSITPSYSECTGNSSTVAKVVTNGCSYKLKALTFSPNSTGSIAVEGCTKMEVDIYASVAKMEANETLCVLGVPSASNTGITGIAGVNEGSGTGRHVKLTINSSNVDITRISGTAANCGAENKTTGTYTGTINATASKGGSEVGLFVGA